MTTPENVTHRFPQPREIPGENHPLARYYDRHVSTRHLLHWLLLPNPNLQGKPARIAHLFWAHAEELVQLLGDGIELSAGLRKLIEAKDCLVRQALEDGEDIVP